MRALGLKVGSSDVEVVNRPEPNLSKEDEVKLRVLEVGICGTDREEASGGRADAPPHADRLVIGHEMLAEVVEVGSQVQKLKKGDLAVVTVRRGCGECRPCQLHRPDMCYTGRYRERGIKELDGFQAEFVVDRAENIIPVPRKLREIAVLTEPTSIVEKALDEGARIQAARLPEGYSPSNYFLGKRALVAGLGPIGLLAVLVLRLRGAEVFGLDIVSPTSKRPQLLERFGGKYINGKEVDTAELGQRGQLDFICEATGIPKLDFDLLSALGINGAYVLTGVPGESRLISIDGATLMRQLVLKNQVMVGSVNAGHEHFQMAVRDLEAAYEKWGEAVQELITSRVPVSQASDPLHHHSPDEIKTVIDWTCSS